MNETYTFHPPRRSGYIVHLVTIPLLVSGGVWSLWQAAHVTIGPAFVVYLIPVLASASLIPILVYRAYALWNGVYALGRDGIWLRWGWRTEAIPMDQVLGATLANQEVNHPPLPLIWWPGSLVGLRKLPNNRFVEYLAADRRHMVLISTSRKVFAITPNDPAKFIAAFQRLMELGSISPIQATSQYPSFLLARVWREIPARVILIAGVLLNILFVIWVSLSLDTQQQIRLGFLPGRGLVPAVRLLLLPILSVLFYLSEMVAGLFFFRRGQPSAPHAAPHSPSASSPNIVIAYILWGNGVLATLLFTLATVIILAGG